MPEHAGTVLGIPASEPSLPMSSPNAAGMRGIAAGAELASAIVLGWRHRGRFRRSSFTGSDYPSRRRYAGASGYSPRSAGVSGYVARYAVNITFVRRHQDNLMPFTLDKTFKVGDLLTSLTIAISALALFTTIERERSARLIEHASKVRASAANAIAKLDRWQAIQLSLYNELQPTFIEVSEGLMKDFDIYKYRDLYWKKFTAERARVARQVLEEQLGTAYADLLAHFPAARTQYTEAFARLSDVEMSVTTSFLEQTEASILSFRERQKSYNTAQLGNALRGNADGHVADMRSKFDAAVLPARGYLLGVIALTDDELVNRSRAP